MNSTAASIRSIISPHKSETASLLIQCCANNGRVVHTFEVAGFKLDSFGEAVWLEDDRGNTLAKKWPGEEWSVQGRTVPVTRFDNFVVQAI